MKYLLLLVPDVELAAKYSAAFWRLCIGGAPAKGNVTTQLNGWIVHPKTGQVALQLPSIEWQLNAKGNPAPIVSLLSTYATDEVKAAMTSQLTALCKGKAKVTLEQLIPDAFKALIFDHETAQKQGWFDE